MRSIHRETVTFLRSRCPICAQASCLSSNHVKGLAILEVLPGIFHFPLPCVASQCLIKTWQLCHGQAVCNYTVKSISKQTPTPSRSAVAADKGQPARHPSWQGYNERRCRQVSSPNHDKERDRQSGGNRATTRHFAMAAPRCYRSNKSPNSQSEAVPAAEAGVPARSCPCCCSASGSGSGSGSA